MRTDTELEKAVKEGAALMDVERADWAVHINKTTFNLASPELCVLGQEYGSYLKGLTALGRTEEHQDELLVDTDWARAHGFDADPDDYDGYLKLERLWLAEIEARRG